MDLKKQIQQLEQIQSNGNGKILSMYLNTDPADPDQQGNKWKITLKNGLRNFEKYINEANDSKEIKAFELVKKKVMDYVEANELDLRKGLIIFASEDGEIWFATRVQVRLKSDFYWQDTPVLDQLIGLKIDYPKSGIILVQTGQVKIIESNMNEVEDTIYYELDPGTDDWYKKSGPQKEVEDIVLLQSDKVNNRIEANRNRWFKNIAPKLDKHAKDGKWEKIFVMGEPEVAHTMLELMNKPVDGVLQKNMLDQDESRVLEAVFG